MGMIFHVPERGWTLLVYKLPPQPTRVRIQIWRKLQAIGAVYLQDGVATLPSRPDLDENLRYIASSIREMAGAATVLHATGAEIGDGKHVVERFRQAANGRLLELLERLDNLEAAFPEIHSLESLTTLETALKAERNAYLKARRLNYCGSDLEVQVDQRLETLSERFQAFVREGK